jgi:hypothetical protein
MPSSPERRRRRIRRTVGAASLATFAVAWGVIAGTGAMGHGGAAATSTAQQSGQRSDDGWGFAAGSDDDAGQSAQRQLPAMTTQQS